VHDNELALKNALLTHITPNIYLGQIAMLTRSPLNVAQTMSRIDNHAIIVARLGDYRVDGIGFLRRNGRKRQQNVNLSIYKSSIPTKGN
tara:strand:+ start:362 stop:628 length:267 start_codon:yes stop_codon:yes gene_type:complete